MIDLSIEMKTIISKHVTKEYHWTNYCFRVQIFTNDEVRSDQNKAFQVSKRYKCYSENNH